MTCDPQNRANPRGARVLCAGMDHAGSGVAQDVELAVGILKLKCNRPGCFRRGTADLSQLELNSIRNVDSHPVLLAGRRAHNRSPARLQHTRDDDPRSPPLDVHLKLNRPEQCWMNRARHGVKHPPVRLGLFGLAPMDNRDQGFTLTLVGALIDNGLHRATTLKDGARPGIEQGKVEAVQRNITEVALVDPHHLEAAAVALRGPALELTGAAVVAVAVGCIADDFTGGTDLAGMLVKSGMRTVQMIGVPMEPLPDDIEAVVIALKSRTTSVNEAIAKSLAALRYLQAAGCRQIYFKYCSTFNSTPYGNIGPVAEALMDALGTDFTIACPAFPANQRTIYKGYLFVGDVLLNESGMRDHPLTPMTDANLVRVLQQQTTRRVGLVDYAVVSKSPAEKKVSNFKTLFLTSLVWKLQSWQASEPSAFTVSHR